MPVPPGRRTRLTVELLEARETPAAGTWSSESFDAAPSAVPTDWGRWPATGVVRVAARGGVDDTSGLVVPAGLTPVRAWEKSVLPADFGVETSFRMDGLVPVQLLVRGRNLNTARPTFYAASVGAGGTVQIVRVIEGTATVLATVKAAPWPAGQWFEFTIRPTGTQLAVTLRRIDTGEFLNTAGRWQSGSTWALTATDDRIVGPGQVGIGRPAGGSGRVRVDDFTVLAPDVPTGGSFNGATLGTLPVGWAGWGSDRNSGFQASPTGHTGNGLTSTGASTRVGRAWLTPQLPADVTATASVLADSLIPAQVIVRAKDLAGTQPTYYAANVVRGMEVKLVRVVNGAATELGTARSLTYLTGAWLDVSVTAQGDRLQVRVRRLDTGEWLNRFGQWQAAPAVAIDATDGAIGGPGVVGLGRVAAYGGTVAFDDFRVEPSAADVRAPTLNARIVARNTATRSGTVNGRVRLLADVRDAGGVGRVEFLIDGELVHRRTARPYLDDFETRDLANGRHILEVRAWDVAGNLSVRSVPFVVNNRSAVARRPIPAHFSHIRVAALAYNGNPMGPEEFRRLRESFDLVVPNARYLGKIDATSPGTPQLIYSNISNLYLDLLTDWLTYADRDGLARESAFYHVARPTPFSGDSPSSQPVNWFWNVARGPAVGTAGFSNQTSQARAGKPGGVAFGGTGESVDVGYPDRFREFNLTMSKVGSSAWTGILEYPSRVDANGVPLAWSELTASTNGLRNSGRVTFDPPMNWTPAIVPGSTARLYYVRIRTTAGSSADAPIAATILGRDFVGANGGKSGTIPAFDERADTNRDGYLADSEFVGRRPGFDARFLYETRLFYPFYGQMRFVTNPSGAGVGAWAADYHRRFLAAHPLADGVFMDNSGGRAPVEKAELVESTATYASDYGAVLGAVNRGIAPKWVLANTSGGGTDADRVVRQVPGTIEEFALRPLAHTWVQFQDLAGTVARRLALSSPAGHLVLDSLSTGGSPTDSRTRMAALASYYLLADPASTMFMAWGGEEPASAWNRHWWDAIGFDVGKPQAAMSEFATGTDPANGALVYHVYQRRYDRALVLYKPLTYAAGKGTGGTGDGTVTIHRLDGRYRLLNADGTFGPVTATVSLRNGEGAILVRA